MAKLAAAERGAVSAEKLIADINAASERFDAALSDLAGLRLDLARIRRDMATMHGVSPEGGA
ncbi:hypothetical protein [Hoeflea sp.]|uniref:hypothetical protein n=1 Tax=Hoeflea sp. TaxID=1940281 RepID=UPI003B51D48D